MGEGQRTVDWSQQGRGGGPEELLPTVRTWTGCAWSVLLPTWAPNEAYEGLGPITGVGQGEVRKGDGSLHQVGKGYSQLPEKDGPGGAGPGTYILRLPGIIGR